MKLENKVAIVTGGSSGIGLAITKDFLANGCKVVVGSWSKSGEEVIESLNNSNVKFIKCDVSDEEEVKHLIKETINLFGKLDILVANAGIDSYASIHEETLEEWNKVINVDLTGVFLCNKYAILEMLKSGGGSIVNISSILGVVSSKKVAAYTAAKSGVVALTKCGAIDYGKNNIRVNAVSPGYIETPMSADLPPELKQRMLAMYPLGRAGKPEEIASAVRYLASDEASFITGEVLVVDGGFTIQ